MEQKSPFDSDPLMSSMGKVRILVSINHIYLMDHDKEEILVPLESKLSIT
jgi:hypothetical protein